jgi:hypothetical protein
MFIDDRPSGSALRQEGYVYRRHGRVDPPSVRRAMCLIISEELENIFGFVCDVEFPQHRQVFILETLFCMVLLLVANVPNHRI